jgi:antitoxin (DNA-binding transcriptional repressor) of toxin-antitoxin stability system
MVRGSEESIEMPGGEGDEISVGVAAFKARCLALIDDVARGKTRRVVLTKRHRPVAAIVPMESGPTELWGALRGTVRVAPGTDLTGGTSEEWAADL